MQQIRYRNHIITLRPGSLPRYACQLLRYEILEYLITHRQQHNWTPSGMLQAAEKFTGNTYAPGEHRRAAQDLAVVLELSRGSNDR